MDARTWLHGRVVGRAALTALLGEGADSVLQYKSYGEPPQHKPYVVLKLGETERAFSGDGEVLAARTFAQIWVHDDPGSYLAIDAVILEARAALEGDVSDSEVIRAEWLETSGDMEDPSLGTVMRWARLQLIHLAPLPTP